MRMYTLPKKMLASLILTGSMLLLSVFTFAQTVYSIPNSGCSTCNDGAYGPVDICDGEYTAEADIFPGSSLTYGTVSKIAYDQISGSQSNVPIKIYMASTSASTFSSDGTWSSVISGATLVFSGNVSFTSSGWNTITLNTPYNYSSGNLEVMIETDWGTSTKCSNNPVFYYYTALGNIDQFWEGSANSSSALQSETGVIGDQPAPIQVTITACSNPTITAQPSTSTQSICQNSSATALSLTATGTTLTYQWYKNSSNSNSGGTAISGATSSSYGPSTATVGTLYYYCTVYSNGGCPVNSNASGAITINSTPTISSQSTGGQTLCQGSNATAMSVNATGISLTYQWYSNTANSNSGGTSINGATSSSYTPSTSNTGTLYYYCTVYSNGACPVASAVSGAVVVNGTSAPTGTSPQVFCSSSNSTISNLTATGTSIQWYSAAIGGSALAGTTTLTTGTIYYATQTVSGCQSASRLAVTVMVNAAPTITSQATGAQTVCRDSFAFPMSVTTTGTSLTYQWYSDTTATNSGGALIAGATSSNYTPSTVKAGTTYYYCVVSGVAPCASVVSNVSGAIVSYLCNINGLTAGGDLSGSYPNPTVSKINGNTIPPNANGYLRNDGSGNLAWASGVITGAGIINTIPVWTNSNTIGNSPITIAGSDIGIGTSTPTANLSVTGTINYTDGNQTQGKVLTTDANGNATWQTPAVIPSPSAPPAVGYIPLWTSPEAIGSSVLYQSGGNIGIATLNTPQHTLDVGGDINASGMLQAVSLNVTGSNITLPGVSDTVQADTLPALLQVDKSGHLSPLDNTSLHNLLYHNMYTCNPVCNGQSYPQWGYTPTSGINVTTPAVLWASGCDWVGIGTRTPDAPLTVLPNTNSIVSRNLAFSVQSIVGSPCSPSSTPDVFTIDGAGNTFMAGQLNVSIPGATNPIGGLTATFSNNGVKVFTASNMLPGDWNPIAQTGDNGIFWSDGYAGNTSSGFVIAPWAAFGAGIRIASNGNVAIGTNVINDPYMLDVSGTIHGYEVKVCNVPGCDFVFDNTYKLMPLDTLNAYLKYNHHLPGIASAKQMADEGSISLGEMDKQLLQKVEELTLYILQQQQQAKQQEQQATIQNEKMKHQEEEIKVLEGKLNILINQVQK